MIQAKPICKKDLSFVDYLRTENKVMIYFCKKCRKEYHEYQLYWSNYEWLIKETENI